VVAMPLQRLQNILYCRHNWGCRLQFKTILYTLRFFKSLQIKPPHLTLGLIICRSGSVRGFAMACSNTFGLVTGAFLLGFGMSEIPKGIWLNADWAIQQKFLSHKVAKMAVKLDDAHQDFSNAIVVS